MKNVIIGTAGHIDHGKTTLIKALTGRETDRLKEEKKRGISIDLGFTYFDLPSGKRAGIVDVPGHEKFIKNMLAGVSGMDLVLLVVAADEGVMPQTIEHLDILNFLNIENGIIVLTKSDLVEDEFLELVKEDIREKVKDTFLRDSLFIEVDSITGRGIDKLIDAIDEITEKIEDRNINSPARLNVDRVFSVKGFGTVITGTLIEGKINIEDTMTIFPKNINTKVRSIQVHGDSVKTAYAGQRVAINIANVKVEDIERGDVLASTNSMEESMMVDIKISLVKHSSRRIEYWDRIRLYHGTREILGRIVPLDNEYLNPGECGYCQLRLEKSVVAKKGDMFVIRFYSPMETIGGGIILDSNPIKHRRFDEEVLKSLKLKEEGDIKEIIEEVVRKHSKEYPDLKSIVRYIGENEDLIEKELSNLNNEKKIVNINNVYIHISHYENLKNKTIQLISDFHKKYPLKKGLVKEELRSKIEKNLKTKDFDFLLNLFLQEKEIKILENIVFIYEFEVKLNELQIKIKNEIENSLKQDKFTPRNISEITEEKIEYEDVLEVLIGDTLIKVSDDLIYHKEYYDKALNLLKDYIKEKGSINLGEFRDLIGASRKYAMALLDDFDRNKITRRLEDKRVLI